MIIISKGAQSQIKDLISQFCGYKTTQEYGRSAFWIWIDKIQNEVNSLSVAQSKKVGSESYVYQMQYWGKIFFTSRRVRIKGRFVGSIITVSEFQFDEENLYNWLQHQAPIEHKDAKPNVPDPRSKPQSIKLGFFKVKAKSGLWAVADSSGKPIDDEWFKDITTMRKSAKGEIVTIVNKDGWAYAYYPNRDKKQRLVPMNKTYSNIIAESELSRICGEEVRRFCSHKRLTESIGDSSYITITESDIKGLIRSVLSRQRALMESKYEAVSYDETVSLDNGNKIKSLVTISDGAGRYDIGEDDGCYVVYQDKQHKGAMYIFPELHNELKKLPNLPLH